MTQHHSGTEGSQCPLCGGDNHCAVPEGRDPAGCWCMSARFPQDIFKLIPPEERGKACICPSCLEAFRQDPAGLARRTAKKRP